MNAPLNKLLDTVLEQVHGALRFKWWALAVAWVVCVVGWSVVFFMPDRYAAYARVYVDTRTSLAPVISGLAINQDVNAQLNLVRQSLIGGPQLEKLASDAGLSDGVTTREGRARMLDELRRNVFLEGRDSGGGTIFTIGFDSPSRDTSLRVVEILLANFQRETLGGKRAGTETAQNFLKQQIAEYEQRLREAEQRLADFKRRNVGQMPGAQGDYFSRLQREMQELEKVRSQLTVVMTRREELQRQLRGEHPTTTANVADPADETSRRVEEARARLDDLLLRFTEKHPDVLAARETLKQLEDRRDAERETLRQAGVGALASSGSNPVLQKIQQAFNDAEVEVAALRGEIAERERRVAELRGLVNVVPDVEAQFSRLNRDYDVTRAQYTALLERLEKANLGEEAESTESIRFEVVDPPSAGFQPVAPKRRLLMTGVLVAALGAGGGFAYLLSLLRPVFLSSRSLAEMTSLPVLGVVSMTWLDRHRRAQMASYVWLSIGVLGLLVVLGLAIKLEPLGVRMARSLIS